MDNIEQFKKIKNKAKKGDVVAQYNLGVLYLEGKGTDQDFKKAFECFKKAASKGHVAAQYNLGGFYLEGKGTEQDLNKAFEWIEQAANQNATLAQYTLGGLYLEGKGTEKDLNKAFECFKKAAEQGYDKAQHSLGWLYLRGKGTEQDFKQAFYWFSKAAEQKYALAQYTLGVLYLKWRGTKQDFKQAFYWFRKAAKQNFALAQNNLGMLYLEGKGTEQDLNKAFYWFEQAANQNFAPAQYNLGLLYLEEIGTERDDKKAFEWFEQAANQNFAPAQYNLGMRYLEDKGTDQDFKQAFDWFEKAAKQRYDKAQFINDSGQYIIFYYLIIHKQKIDVKGSIFATKLNDSIKHFNQLNEEDTKCENFLNLSKFIYEYLFKDIVENDRSKDYVHHYTSRASLEKILPQCDSDNQNNPTLLLNHISAMNDEQEGKLLWDKLKVDLSQYNNWIEESLSTLYVVSFSSGEGLDDNLSQWRAYGDECQGVCISIPKKYFENKLSITSQDFAQEESFIELKNKFQIEIGVDPAVHIPSSEISSNSINKIYTKPFKKNSSFLFGKVIYINDELPEDLENIISQAKELIKDKSEDSYKYMVNCFKLLIPFLKDKSYQDENEWRYVVFNPEKIDFKENKKTGMSSPVVILDTEASGNPLFTKTDSNLPYKITLGCCCPYKDNVKLTIKERLKQYNRSIKVEVVNSKIKYR